MKKFLSLVLILSVLFFHSGCLLYISREAKSESKEQDIPHKLPTNHSLFGEIKVILPDHQRRPDEFEKRIGKKPRAHPQARRIRQEIKEEALKSGLWGPGVGGATLQVTFRHRNPEGFFHQLYGTLALVTLFVLPAWLETDMVLEARLVTSQGKELAKAKGSFQSTTFLHLLLIFYPLHIGQEAYDREETWKELRKLTSAILNEILWKVRGGK